MKLDRYDYTVDRLLLHYRFTSSGPNGNIRKIISFVPRNEGGKTFFVLEFGDYSDTKGVDHFAVSDNKDTEKILATIAAAIIEFTTSFPDMGVYASGSTQARTRLYQMNIRKYLKDVEVLLIVYGHINGKWEIFQENVNYNAFFVLRKNVTL